MVCILHPLASLSTSTYEVDRSKSSSEPQNTEEPSQRGPEFITMRVAEYVAGCGDKHGLILSPKSLQVVAKSDASYAEHVDGKSHTGGCVGFESDNACWFMWLSTKQPVVALSTCESELIESI